MRPLPTALAAWALLVLALAGPARAQETSCVACHSDADYFDEESLEVVARFQEGIHASVNLSCHDCHGGNPDPALADDMEAAMDPDHEANPYRGSPDPQGVPAFCGTCHSDPSYMNRYAPGVRVDQVAEYRTSHHGKALAEGNEKVATCVSCHHAHGILRAENAESPVYPTRIAETCRHCHGDPERMAGVTLPNGEPLPVDQYARWRRSVHATALLEKGDLSAPTCNDCHGNHGATPPGLSSIAFVCGQCHGREAELFRASEKRELQEKHNEYLADVAPAGCPACHEAPDPAASITRIQSFGECTGCHLNHAIVRPTVSMLAPLPDTPCAFCHEPVEGVQVEDLESEEAQQRYRERRDALLAEAEERSLTGIERFDWLVEQAWMNPDHLLPQGQESAESPALQPEFERLYTKFRIGPAHFQYEDPVTGEARSASVRRCNTCHAAEPTLTDEASGLQTAEEMVRMTRHLTATTAAAERQVLRARRGGVEVTEAETALDEAVDAEVEMQVLVHRFHTGEESKIRERYEEGLEAARAALSEGEHALEELDNRRQGLMVSLVFIALFLVALGARIRMRSS